MYVFKCCYVVTAWCLVLFTMPSTGCCNLRSDYCRVSNLEAAAGTAETSVISHFPGRPPGSCPFWDSSHSKKKRRKTNHNSTSTSAYFLFGYSPGVCLLLPGFLGCATIYDRIWPKRDTFSGIFYFAWHCHANARDFVVNWISMLG